MLIQFICPWLSLSQRRDMLAIFLMVGESKNVESLLIPFISEVLRVPNFLATTFPGLDIFPKSYPQPVGHKSSILKSTRVIR